MRRIVVTEFVSADGVMEDPGGAEGFRYGGWTFKFNDDEGMKYKLDETLGHDALLLGRVTYEGFAKAWPGMTDEVGALKAQEGGDILVGGSASLVRGLTDLGLVDEYRLMVFPIVLGEGKRLFDGIGDAATLRLVDAKPLQSGTVILTYHQA